MGLLSQACLGLCAGMHFKTRIPVETARQRPMRSPPGAVLEGERRLPTRIRGRPDKRGHLRGQQRSLEARASQTVDLGRAWEIP